VKLFVSFSLFRLYQRIAFRGAGDGRELSKQGKDAPNPSLHMAGPEKILHFTCWHRTMEEAGSQRAFVTILEV